MNVNDTDATLGSTGKYYCGKSVDICNVCCDSTCGPTNGCNCRACMLIDVNQRMLKPGFLVNREGRNCRVSKSNGLVQCGAMFKDAQRCGPKNETQCEACKIIQVQMYKLYADINDINVVKY